MWNECLPSVKPYYAVKCNADTTLLQWLHRRGAAFDCASAREMSVIADMYGRENVMDNILFANPCKTPQDIETASTIKIPWVTVDSNEELFKMYSAGYSPKVIVRIAVDDTDASCPFGAKFGLEPEKVNELVETANGLNMSVVGISFHVGSGSSRPTAFGSAIHQAKDIWTDLHGKGLVRELEVLDIGGGWSHEEKLFKDQAGFAKLALQKGPLPQKQIAEPGRFFAAPVYDLYVRVVGKKPRNGGGWRYTIDESIYGQFSCIPFDHAKPSIYRVKQARDERPVSPATIFGRTCDSLDWIANSVAMEELDVGDWLYIPSMGAYTIATSTEFNGFPKPETFITDEVPEKSSLNKLPVVFPLASMLNIKDAEMR